MIVSFLLLFIPKNTLSPTHLDIIIPHSFPRCPIIIFFRVISRSLHLAYLPHAYILKKYHSLYTHAAIILAGEYHHSINKLIIDIGNLYI